MLGPIAFTVGDVETPATSLVVTASLEQPDARADSEHLVRWQRANRTLTITPAADQFGTTVITLTVRDTDGGKTKCVVHPHRRGGQRLADPVRHRQPDDRRGVAKPINFTVGDVETPSSQSHASATSGNTTLLPVANIVFGGSGANRTATLTPAANQFGTALVTVTVSDGSAQTSRSPSR